MSEEDLKFIEGVTRGFQIYVRRRSEKGYERGFFEDMCCYIIEVLSMWTGYTYVGQKKDEKTKMVFQNFFEILLGLIRHFEFYGKDMSSDEREFARMATYEGVIYRYLGSNNQSNKQCVEIEYNDIYVSWSKNKQNAYLESKLYGPWLLIKGQTLPFEYAIDIEGIEKFYQDITSNKVYVVKGQEREVVYPTKKGCVLEVKKY